VLGCVGAFGAITSPLVNVDDNGPMKEAIEDSMGNGGVAEHRAQFLEAYTGSDNQGCTVLTGVDQLQQETRVFGFGSDMIHGVDDEKVKTSKL